MIKLTLSALVFTMVFISISFGQHTSIFSVKISASEHILKKVVVEKTSLGYYVSKIDTFKTSGQQFTYQSKLNEPEFITFTFHWEGKKATSISFWAEPTAYKLLFDKHLNPKLVDNKNLTFAHNISKLEHTISKFLLISDSLVRNVSYENQKISDVEDRINYLRDSINLHIDEVILKQTFLSHLNSPLGLYALIKYAERPYSDQRIKIQPNQIEELLRKFTTHIKLMPSAKALEKKIDLNKELIIGKAFKYVALADTLNKLIDLSNFKGKYLLIDFWASWCVPCRDENTNLIENYKKYKSDGFQIISISRDKNSDKTSWLKAINADQIGLWPQLSDFNNIARDTYGIRFLPSNFLINPEGVIIAKDIFSKHLDLELIRIFKR